MKLEQFGERIDTYGEKYTIGSTRSRNSSNEVVS
jgi:hypothetical protein